MMQLYKQFKGTIFALNSSTKALKRASEQQMTIMLYYMIHVNVLIQKLLADKIRQILFCQTDFFADSLNSNLSFKLNMHTQIMMRKIVLCNVPGLD